MKYSMKYQILLIIFLLAFASSLLLSQGWGCEEACNIKSDKVNSLILNKEINGYAGMTIFLIMFLITLSQIKSPTKFKKFIIYAGIIVGSVIALYFLYLQTFVLNSYCKYCLIIDIGLFIALILIIFTWRK